MQPGRTIQPCGLGNETLPQTAALSRRAESLQLVGKYYLGGLVFLFGSLYTERNRNTNSRRK